MRPHALKQTYLAVARAVIIAVCLSAPASAQSTPTPTPTPTAASKSSLSISLAEMANRAKDLLPIIRNELEGPLLPWLEKLSLLVAVLVMIAAFARLWRENAGAGVDLFWWFARLGVIFALLGSGPRIVDGIYATGLHIAEGSEETPGPVQSSVLLQLCSRQRVAFDLAYTKFTNNLFTVNGASQTPGSVPLSSVIPRLGVLLSEEISMPDPDKETESISTKMPLFLDSLNFSRAVISFGDLFLTLLSSFLLIAMRLAAPIMIALAIDRSLAQRVTYPYLWGVVVLTLIWPIIVLIIKSIAYLGGNVAMALGDKTPFYLFDETTMGIIKNGSQEPGYTVAFAAVIMLISGLSLWASPYIAYQLSFGGVYETVSQTISGWAGQFKGAVIGNDISRTITAMGAAIAGRPGMTQAGTASARAMTQADPASNSQHTRIGSFPWFGSHTPMLIPGNNVPDAPLNFGFRPPVGGVIKTTGANRDIEQGLRPQFRPLFNGSQQESSTSTPPPTKFTK